MTSLLISHQWNKKPDGKGEEVQDRRVGRFLTFFRACQYFKSNNSTDAAKPEVVQKECVSMCVRARRVCDATMTTFLTVVYLLHIKSGLRWQAVFSSASFPLALSGSFTFVCILSILHRLSLLILSNFVTFADYCFFFPLSPSHIIIPFTHTHIPAWCVLSVGSPCQQAGFHGDSKTFEEVREVQEQSSRMLKIEKLTHFMN